MLRNAIEAGAQVAMENPPEETPDILVVDDTLNNLRFLSTLLSSKGYQVRKALNGSRAFSSIRSCLPDLILLDIMLPEMSGYDICQRLKADPVTQHIPVIFISALDSPIDKVRAFQVGGVDYISKPFEPLEVMARVECQLTLRRLQRQLLQHNEELQRSNQELDFFATSISHDLQQPLQSMMGYAKVLKMKRQNCFDSKDRQHLEAVLAAGQRMQRLIEDVLAYARAGQMPQAFEKVSCDQLMTEVVANLAGAIADTQAQICWEPLPTILGKRASLLILFQNLIDNAIKFRRAEVPLHIEVSALEFPEGWRFMVKDNGVGIPAGQENTLYELFRRSPNTASRPGSGIGLATCKRIATAHGGSLRMVSQPDQGTTVEIWLPKQIPTVTWGAVS